MEILALKHTQVVCVGGVFVCVFLCVFVCVCVFSPSHDRIKAFPGSRKGGGKREGKKRNQRLPRTNLRTNNFYHFWKYSEPLVSYHPKPGTRRVFLASLPKSSIRSQKRIAGLKN